jgi:tetratricopeptide (TPR) repeat protein
MKTIFLLNSLLVPLVCASSSMSLIEDEDVTRHRVGTSNMTEETCLSASDVTKIHVENALQSANDQKFIDAASHWRAADLEGYSFPQQHLDQYIACVVIEQVYEEAFVLLKRLFHTYQNIPGTYHWLYAFAASKVGEWDLASEEAKKYLLTAEHIDPDHYLQIGHIFLKTGRKEESLKAYEEYLATEDPRKINQETYFELADFFYGVENAHMADKCMSEYFGAVEPTRVPPLAHAVSAIYALDDHKIEKAILQWRTYFSLMAADADKINIPPVFYLRASQAYGQKGEYRLAIAYLEKYLVTENEAEYQNIIYMNLGWYWAALGDTRKACMAYDHVFCEEKIEGLDQLSPNRYQSAATCYLSLGQVTQAERVMKVLGHHYPRYKIVLPSLVEPRPSKKASPVLKKTRHPQKGKMGAQLGQQLQNRAGLIQENLRQFHLTKCRDLYERIKKLSLKDRPEMAQSEEARLTLMKRLETILEEATLQNQTTSSSACLSTKPRVSLVDLQRDIIEIEEQIPAFKRLYDKAQQHRFTEQTTAYYRSLVNHPSELISLGRSGNLRSLFPYEKTCSPKEIRSTAQAAMSSHQMPQEELPTVSFHLLKEARKDYDHLMSQPGIKAKYVNFIEELSKNPCELSKGSGKPKRLRGADDLFSRRFDKANRMVYHVKKTGENTYEVTIMSLSGHYKHLTTQQLVVGKMSVSAPKRPVSKEDTFSKKTRKIP